MLEINSVTVGPALVCTFKGRIDNTTSARAERQLKELTGHLEDSGIVFDLSELTFCSSAGLRVFLLAGRQAKAANNRIALCGLQSGVREVFRVSGFDELFPVHADERGALAAVSK